MINERLKTRILSDIYSSYKSIDIPNFHFLLERENWYSDLLLRIKNIIGEINDSTDLNYDVSKSIEIVNKQDSENIYLYLSLVGQYSFLMRNNIVLDNDTVNNNLIKKIMHLTQENNIILLSKSELLSMLPVCIKFDENLFTSTVLGVLFSPGLVLY